MNAFFDGFQDAALPGPAANDALLPEEYAMEECQSSSVRQAMTTRILDVQYAQMAGGE